MGRERAGTLQSLEPPFADDVREDLLAERTERWRTSDFHCCGYDCRNGVCEWSNWSDDTRSKEWEGMESLHEDGTVGLLLNLDKGTLAVYKNNRRLGILKGGLSGEYCWFTTLYRRGINVRIKRSTPS